MKTPEQSVIELIKSLRAKGVAYNTLMKERDRSEHGDEDEDDDTVHRSTESIDREIDELLDETMAVARQLVDSPEPTADEKPNCLFTVIGYYSDTGLRYVGHHGECENAAAAIKRVSEFYSDENITIVAIIPGEHNDVMEGDYCEDTEDYR